MKATDELLKQIKELNIEDFKKQESFVLASYKSESTANRYYP